ncbi:hypothetical protein AKJ08_1597 [Vulgatibacter incomptus]|uniref:LTD domain-containing protein n=1 Tax=Vulgatibacter incomptus TaxID=1391653 RepID=A0A0K1PCH4_9BACT|nr:hypothetical protein AKJ08_1597 [Vulgatibacter incomptus]
MIDAGGTSEIAWKTRDALRLLLVDASGHEIDLGGAPAADGRVEVHPSASTTYELTAIGARDLEAKGSVTVTVRSAQGPQVVSFTATPAKVAPGEPATLAWTTTNADSIRIHDGAGHDLELGSAGPGEGSIVVNPDRTTTYTLEAKRGEEVASRSVKVEVEGSDPRVEFAAASGAIDFGSTTVLSWYVTGAVHVTIGDGFGATVAEGDGPAGEATVAPTRTTTYSLVASLGDGSVDAFVTVRVLPVITSFEAEFHGDVLAGDLLPLRWTTRGAESLTVSNLEGFIADIPESARSEGTFAAPVGTGGVFSLVAKLGSEEVTTLLPVPVLHPPEHASLTATPSLVTATTVEPALVRLDWSASPGAHATIEAMPGGVVEIAGDAESGSVEVEVSVDTAFVLTATNAAGNSTAMAAVRVVAPAIVDSFTATPARVGAGESFELAWTTTGATAVELLQDGAKLSVEAHLTTGTYVAQIAADSTFTLRAMNEAGDLVEQALAVSVGAPIVVSFDTDKTTVNMGETVTFSWVNLGGIVLWVEGPDGPIPACATSVLGGVARGSCAVAAPTAAGDFVYELVVTNGVGGEGRRSITISVQGGPVIASFTRSAPRITAGQSVSLRWDVSTDASGVAAELALVDDLGTAYPIAGLPAQGSLDVHPAVGDRTFTLTASTPGYAPSTATVSVEVLDAPTVTLAASTPSYDPGSGIPMTLSWTAAHATSLRIEALDPDGNEGTEIFVATPAQVAAGSGSLQVSPEVASAWRAIATNELGAQVTASAYVDMVEAEIVSFVATPDQILAGTTSTLTWETRGVSHIDVNVPRGYSIERTTEPFIDVSGSATARTTPLDNCDSSWLDEGCPLVSFPDGFAFPFDGADRTRARIYENGLISFDLERTGSNFIHYELPDDYVGYVHLAAFWDDLDRVDTGDVLYDVGVGDDGRQYLVVQWSHVQLSGNPADLNFEIVLWEDGSFEYRYDSMWSDENLSRARGDNATIGYQNTSGSEGTTISYSTEVPDLEGTGYRFAYPSLGPNGSAIVSPSATQVYTLTAYGYDGTQHTATTTVTVEQPVVIVSASAPADVDVGDTFEVRWIARDALTVTVSDETGVVCISGPGEVLDEGTCTFPDATEGAKTITVEATGAMGSTASRTIQVLVWVPFGLDSFEVADDVIDPGGSTTLAWLTHGAETLTLTANGLPLDVSGYDFSSDTYVAAPEVSTIYELTIAREDGRSFTQRRSVRVLRVQLDAASAGDSRIVVGGSTTVSWSASSPSGDPVSVLIFGTALDELDPDEAPFIDISATGTELTWLIDADSAAEDVYFPNGFTFPFAGEDRTAVRVMSDGFLSFDPEQGTLAYHDRLPSSWNPGVHLAPFWDDLHSYETGHVYAQLLDDGGQDRFVIQWKGVQYYDWPAPGANLNFEVILFPNGSFEFRYGAMMGPDQERADGGNATVGYQDPSGEIGSTLSYNRAMAGGLSNRAWRFEGARDATGSAQVSPGRDGRIVICAQTTGDIDCQTIVVEVLPRGLVAITELQIDPSGGPTAQWFEIRNLSPAPMDLEGMVIWSGDQSHVIESGGPLLLASGAWFTFAASDSPGFTPDYVYDDITLDSTEGDLSIGLGGVPISQVAWNSWWTIPHGASLALDGTWQTQRQAGDLTPSFAWCVSTSTYGEGGDLGSPGAGGVDCYSEYDVDFYSTKPFIDISATGTELPDVNSDYGQAEIPGGIPFHFPYYGGSDPVTTVYVQADGTAYFLDDWWWPAWDGGILRVYDADLTDQPGSKFQYEVMTVGPSDVLILQWTGFKRYYEEGSLTFQIQLWEGGDIVFAYDEIAGGPEYFDDASAGVFAIGGFESFEYEDGFRSGQSMYFHYR